MLKPITNIINKVFDSILESLGITIKGQNITLTQKQTGVDNPVSVLVSGSTITADGTEHALSELDINDYAEFDVHVDLSLAAGSCTLKIQQSQDNSTYKYTRFKVNDDGAMVISHTFNSGDDPILLTFRKSAAYARLTITDDATNDITENVVWATRRVK